MEKYEKGSENLDSRDTGAHGLSWMYMAGPGLCDPKSPFTCLEKKEDCQYYYVSDSSVSPRRLLNIPRQKEESHSTVCQMLAGGTGSDL